MALCYKQGREEKAGLEWQEEGDREEEEKGAEYLPADQVISLWMEDLEVF